MNNLRTRLTLFPGDHSAKQLDEQYGEQLVCVRYRYDEQQQKRFKTVELIIKEYDRKPQEKIQPTDAVVPIRVAPSEWDLRHDRVIDLGLEGRIVRQESR